MKFPYWLLSMLLLLVKNAYCVLNPLPDETLARESLVQCVLKACKQYVDAGEIIKVSLALTEVDSSSRSSAVIDRILLKALFDEDKWSVIVKKSKESLSGTFLKSISDYIIQVRHPTELQDHLKGLKHSQDWNPHAQFWIITVRTFNDSLNVMKNFTNLLWSYKVTNGLIYYPRANDSKKFDIYSYFPYKGKYCGDPSESIEVINSCWFGKYKFKTDLFENKIPKNLHRCRVKVRVIVFPPYAMPPVNKNNNGELIFRHGLEISMMNFMSNVSNFRVDYSAAISKSDWGVIEENGTATGSLLYLQNEFIDILIGAFSVTLERLKYYDIVPYDFLEDVTMCVPHALDKSQWEKLIDVMSLEAWCVVVMGFLIVSLSLWIFSKYTFKELRYFKNLENTVQACFAVLVSNPIKQPITFTIRMIFFVWVLFCLHATVAYQTSLVSFLTKPRYGKQVQSFSDIVENNYTILFLPNTKRYFIDRTEDDSISKIISDKMATCDDVPACLRKVAYERNAAMGSPRLYMKYALNNYRSPDGEPLLYCFKNSVITYSLGMLMWKGFPLKPVLGKLVSAMTSAGFIMKWEKEIFAAKLKYDSEEEEITQSRKANSKLTLLELEAVFILLMVGNLAGLVVFLFEIYFYRRMKRKKCKIERKSKKRF